MPHVVAITRPPETALPGSYREHGPRVAAPVDTWLVPMAAALGMTAFDLRLRLGGAPPWIVARVATSADAEALLARLRAAGAGGVTLDLATPLLATALVARAFVREEGVALEPEQRVIGWNEILLAVHATLEAELGREVTRYAGNDGMGVTRHTRERERRQGLYLCVRDAPAVRLLEGGLGLPEAQAATVRGRFDAFVASVRDRVGAERMHTAFVTEPRKRTSLRALAQSETQRATLVGNAEETDLAVALLAKAVIERQR